MASTSKADSFAALIAREGKDLVERFLADGSAVQTKLAGAELSPSQQTAVREALEVAIDDTLYTVLLAFDGEASLGGTQQQYSILDESGEPIYKPGELEAAAWLYFHRPLKHNEDDI